MNAYEIVTERIVKLMEQCGIPERRSVYKRRLC